MKIRLKLGAKITKDGNVGEVIDKDSHRIVVRWIKRTAGCPLTSIYTV